jgi:uncharacterized membrane protein
MKGGPMKSVDDRIKDAMKVLEITSSVAFMLGGYFIVAIVLGALGLLKDSFTLGYATFAFFLAIYIVSNIIRRRLMTEEEKKAEDDYLDWTNSQRPGP